MQIIRMKPVCEIIVQSVLPALRAMLAKELVEKHGLTQREAAHMLGMTQPAISHYQRELRGYRAKVLSSSPHVLASIKELAAQLATGKIRSEDGAFQFCGICREIRSGGLACGLHRDRSPGLAECSACMNRSSPHVLC